ncbi:MAG: altronate dehydratase family protein [Rhodothermales bacterium]
MFSSTLLIHPNDNVVVALTSLEAGATVQVGDASYTLRNRIPPKHKFAARDFAPGDPIHMYGGLVGRAQTAIPKGSLLTTSNVTHAATGFSEQRHAYTWTPPDVSRWATATFEGYHRTDGQVGTQNVWLVVPLVFCENRNVQTLQAALAETLGYAPRPVYQAYAERLATAHRAGASIADLDALAFEVRSTERQARLFPNVDGLKVLTHHSGCGESRADSETLCALLAGYLNHPNIAGATVLSLGCQNAQVKVLEQVLADRYPHFNKPLHIFDQQQIGVEQTLVSEALKKTFLGVAEANRIEREPAPLSHLTFGMECGGSDGFSGLSANPAMGHTADLLVALGGKVLLSEFPELCGVEQQLIDRCVDTATAARFIAIQRAYAARAERDGFGFDMNPSPGNIKDGLITDAMKSAGAAKKGGTAPVADVLDYTEPATKSGLSLLCTPGNDVESTTGLAGSGANIIFFSTGLGTPTGNPVAPVIKVASNTALAQRMPDVIDMDTGAIIRGEQTVETMGEQLLDLAIEVASGRRTTRAMDLGQDDFIPWKRGISL